MKILFASSFALFAGTRYGGAKRLYYLARELARRHELHLLCFDACREWPPGATPPEEFPRSLYLRLHDGNPKSLLRRALSIPVDIAEELALNRAALDRFLGGAAFDATLAAFPMALSVLGPERRPRLGKIAYLEDDLLFEGYRQGYAPGTGRSPAARLKDRVRHRQSLAYYREKLAGIGVFVCISPQESGIVRAHFPGMAAPVLKYGLPLGEFPFLPAPSAPEALGFIGNYRHGPNLDAALWLARDLFPALASRRPGLRLVLAGSGMPDELKRACAGNACIRLMEEVPEVTGFYREIGVFVNPIRTGRGLRTKVVEAAACGRPVVSTPLGAEGLEELDLPAWEDAEGLGACVEEVLGADRYQSLRAANRAAVETHFGAEGLAARLAGWLSP